jgi:Type IV secretion system pilin
MMFSVFTFITSQPAIFGAAACNPDDHLFKIIPSWYEYLNLQTINGSCEIVNFKVPEDFLPVGLAIVDMLLRLGGLAAMIAIIAAGVGYITAGGDASKAASARRRIYNGLIGLAIVFVAAGFVAFIGNYLVK